MAIDEAIFLAFKNGQPQPTLRIYGWRPRAFSLGYFQDAASTLDMDKCRRDDVAFVRRITGGSAIFHHRELTYSLACSASQINAGRHVVHSFKASCSFITGAYKKLGLTPEFAIDAATESCKSGIPVASDSFCFVTREKYDILLKRRKIGGNAQKRHKDIVFQHGSIPLTSDVDAAVLYLRKEPENIKNEVCALEEALGRSIAFNEVEQCLIESFEESFCAHFLESELTFKEEQLARRLRGEKYANDDWNCNRKDSGANAEAVLA